ncbi:hemin-degrading factor [Neisseriaceae bacterium ESL0693]|nr:hemin-degrading factor [Neisseriaceae bacterium ESL0693]
MSLWQQYLVKKDTVQGPYFPKQAAEEMGVSEGALIADAPDTIYLGTAIRDLVLKLDTLGEILSVVRNDVAVHEKVGLYEHVTLTARSGLALNVGGIDLRFFLQNWHHALATTNVINDKTRYSIQFYDEFGVAVEKVFLHDDSKVSAWQALVDEFKTEGKPEFIHTERPSAPVPQPLSAERESAFQERWLELKDVHHFTGLLETFALDRQQSYRHAPVGMTKQLDNSIWQQVLEQVRDREMKIMIFVGNRGLVQIQTGRIHNLKRAYGYLNVLDSKEPEQFDLHLRDDLITETWLVRRPISEGYVTCIEGFDQYRQSVIQIFGFRAEGDDEMVAWHKLTDDLFA